MDNFRQWKERLYSGSYRKIGRIFGVLCILGGLAYAGHWLVWRIGHVTTDAAYIKADIAHMAVEIPGRIIAIPVREGQWVEEGQVLIRIDPEQADRHSELARAELASILARKERYGAEVALAEGTVPAAIDGARAALVAAEKQKIKAQANLDLWQRQYRRFKGLLDKEIVSRARFEEVEAAFKSAQSDFKTAEAQIGVAKARLAEAGASKMTITKANAAYRETAHGVRQAEEALKLAMINRARCDVKAPISGVIARLLVQEGDFASPGRPVLGIYNPATRYVEARFEEVKLQHVAPGKKVELVVDSLAGRRLAGTITLVAPASAAEFAIIPRDISAGEFTKVVQRVPVKIAIDNLEKHPELVPGLSVEVVVAR